MTLTPAVSDQLPLKAVDFHILLVLMEGELHGYGIVKEIERRSEGRVALGAGNLYRYVRRLVDEGMLTPAGRRVTEEDPSERRRYYALTDFGRQVLTADAQRMRAMANAVEATLAVSDGPGQ